MKTLAPLAFVTLLTVVGAGCAVASNQENDAMQLSTFNAVYAAQWNNIRLGEIHIRLTRESEHCYQYVSEARPVRLVRAFYGTPSEKSYFCLVDGQVRPVHFEFDHGKDSFQLDFDWVNGVVRGGPDGDRELPYNAQDRFGMQQAARAWVMSQAPGKPEGDFTFSIVEDDRIREYTLRATGEEKVTVPAGEFEAYRLERVDKDRLARFWVAPGADAMPVKVETGRNGNVQLRMELQTFERTGPDTE